MNDDYDNAKTDREMLERYSDARGAVPRPDGAPSAEDAIRAGREDEDRETVATYLNRVRGQPPAEDALAILREAQADMHRRADRGVAADLGYDEVIILDSKQADQGLDWAGSGFGGKALPMPARKVTIDHTMNDRDLAWAVIAVAGYERWDALVRRWIQFRPEPLVADEDADTKPCMSCSADAGHEVSHTEAQFVRIHQTPGNEPAAPSLRDWYRRKLSERFTRE